MIDADERSPYDSTLMKAMKARPISILLLCIAPTLRAAEISVDEAFPNSVIRQLLPETNSIEAPEYFSELDITRAELFAGQYRKALYRTYGLKGVDESEVSRLRAEALGAIGEVETALALLPGNDRDSRILRGKIFFDAGRARESIDEFESILKDDSKNIESRWLLGQSLEAVGDLEKAIEIYSPLADTKNGALGRWISKGSAAFNDDARTIVAAGLALDRWATLTSAYTTRPDLHDVILNFFIKTYDMVDREYWPAHVAAARFMASRDDTDSAIGELGEANNLNPFDAQLNVTFGELMLHRNNLAGAWNAVTSLRSVNSNDARADVLESKIAQRQRRFAQALELAERAAEARPNDLEALSNLAAAQYLSGKSDESEATIARIEAIDPDNALVYATIGAAQTSVRGEAEAIPWFEKAIARAPWWVEPHHQLGNALMHEGDEDRARAILAEANQIDPYNVVTLNYVRLLNEMSSYHEFESRHFTWRFAPEDDPIVPLVIAPAMDESYEGLVADFRYEPDRKPIIEVMPDKQSFSVRTAGRPGFETWGASLGRVMTVIAPRHGSASGPFNWYRVMTHEFTHTLNLMATKGRVPRWFTEGLAVWEEKVPYRFPYVPEEMFKRITTDKFFTIQEAADILEGRGGGRGAHDGEIAYMTGFWCVRFIDETIGHDAIIKILNGYRDGLEDEAVFKNATGMSIDEFNKNFHAWAKEQVKDWGYDEETASEYASIADQAEQLTQAGVMDEAEVLWQKAAELQPMNPIPHRRLAGVLLKLGRELEAAEHLKATLHVEWQDNRFAKRLARIYEKANQFDEMLEWARQSVRVDPYDVDAHQLLADAYKKLGKVDEAKSSRELIEKLKEEKSSK